MNKAAAVKNRLKKYGVCLLAPLFVLLFLSAFFAVFKLYPFGGYSFSWCDMNQQVIPFMAQLQDIVSGDKNLFLSMGSAGGMNFWGVFLFFLASPFSFLTVFVEKQDLSVFMNILVALKLAVCALCASVYFRYKTPRLPIPLQLLLSGMYAFCGYSLLFYQNIMWLDIMYLFPLLLLALDLLLRKNRPALYIAVLTLCVAANFYLSYMTVLCILLFTGVYFCIYRREKQKHTAVSFCLSSLAACLLSAPCWLPALLQFFGSARASNIIKGITDGAFITHVYTVIPLVLCTAVLLPVLIASFFYLKKDRQIRLYFIMLVLTAVPLVLEPVNKMWHTGDYMSFPARYAYMTAFFGIAIFAHILERAYAKPFTLAKQSKPQYFAVSIGVVTLLCVTAAVLLYKSFENVRAYTNTLWGNQTSFLTLLFIFAFLCACYGLLVLLIQKKKLSAKAAAIVLCTVLVCECTLNCTIYIAAPRHNDTKYRTVMDLGGKIDDSAFYRVKTSEKLFDVNLLGAMGYNNLNHYSSLTAQGYLETMKMLGYSSYWMEVGSSGGTLFSDALLSNKYTIYRKNQTNAVYNGDGFSIAQNKYYLPPAVMTNANLSNTRALSKDMARPFIQEELFDSLFEKEALFTRYTPKKITGMSARLSKNGHAQIVCSSPEKEGVMRYTLEITGEKALYFDCFNKIRPALVEEINNSINIYVNGVKIRRDYPSQQENGLLYLGTFQNETVNIQVKIKQDIKCTSYGVYGLDVPLLADTIKTAQTAQVQVDGNTVIASGAAQQGQYMFFSIPYSDGFSARVNGEKVKIYQVYSNFMAVKLSPGENNVTLSFWPPGLAAGLWMAAVGGLGILLFALCKNRLTPVLKRVDRFFTVGVIILSAMTFTAVYIAPVALYLLGRVF